MSDIKTGKDAVVALRHVVDTLDREDYVYPGAEVERCWNFQKGLDEAGHPMGSYLDYDPPTEPSCIVGHVLDFWGLDRKYWIRVEGGVHSTLRHLDSLAVVDTSVFRLDRAAAAALLAAQMAQDSGLTWGKALANAHAMLELFNVTE
jgi:hypothetical protein